MRSQMYEIADRFAVGLKCLRVKEVDAKEEQDDIQADYIVDEKAKTATLTPHGQKRAEAYFKVENLSDPENTMLEHYINQAIRRAASCSAMWTMLSVTARSSLSMSSPAV